MRLIITYKEEELARRFSLFLKEKEIVNKVEKKPTGYEIWVMNEDHLKKALECNQEFEKNPNWAPSEKTLQKEREEKLKEEFLAAANNPDAEPSFDEEGIPTDESRKVVTPSMPSFGKLTLMIILACVAFFIWSQATTPRVVQLPPKDYRPSPLFFTPYKQLTFENPLAYSYFQEFLEKLNNSPGSDGFLSTSESHALMFQYHSTPYWHGLYQTYLLPQSHSDADINLAQSASPDFTQIKQGEVWRLFTPALLHGNFLHLLFNLLWFIILGNQIEQRIGFWKFLILIGIIGIVTNVSQYLMSGPNFLGISGVVMGLGGYIWMRQSKAAWEGYAVQRPTLYFLALYVVLLFLLQVASFILVWFGLKGIPLNIANTAHIVGALTGLLLGRGTFFAAWSLGKMGR